MTRLTKQQIADAAEAQIKADQQAELKRLRVAKAAATRAKNKLKGMITPAPAFDAQAEDAKRDERMAAAFEVLMDQFEVPSWKRWLTAFTVGLLAACGTGYLVGTLVGMLCVAVVGATGMAWLGLVIAILGIIAGGMLGGRAGSAMYSYIADGKIDAVYHSAKSTVTGWFKKPAIVQFSGVHAA